MVGLPVFFTHDDVGSSLAVQIGDRHAVRIDHVGDIGDVAALPVGRAIPRIAPPCDLLCVAGSGRKVKQDVAVDPLVRGLRANAG